MILFLFGTKSDRQKCQRSSMPPRYSERRSGSICGFGKDVFHTRPSNAQRRLTPLWKVGCLIKSNGTGYVSIVPSGFLIVAFSRIDKSTYKHPKSDSLKRPVWNCAIHSVWCARLHAKVGFLYRESDFFCVFGGN